MAMFAAGTPQSFVNDYYKNNPWDALPAGPAQQTKQPSPQSQPVFGTQSGGAYSAYKPGNAQPQPSARTVRFDTLQEAQGMQQYLQGLGHTAPAVTARDGGYGFGAPPPPPQGMHYSSYNPGQAQPQQQPSLGTAYNPQQPNPFPFAQQPPLPPFQFQATDFMGNQFNNPGAFTAQQGAMAQALNQQRTQQIGNMFTQGTPMGSLDPFAAYGQGQQMMQGGFQNPFAPQPASQTMLYRPPSGGMDPQTLNPYAPPPAYQPPPFTPSPAPQAPVPQTNQRTTWEQVGNQLVERKAGTPMLDSQGRQVYQQAGVDWGQKRGNAFVSAMHEQGYVPEQMRGPTALAPMRERAGQMADDYIRQQQTAMYGQPFAQPAWEIGKQPQPPARLPEPPMPPRLPSGPPPGSGGRPSQQPSFRDPLSGTLVLPDGRGGFEWTPPPPPGHVGQQVIVPYFGQPVTGPTPLPPPGQAQPGFGGPTTLALGEEGSPPPRPGQAQPVQQPSQGTPYNPGQPPRSPGYVVPGDPGYEQTRQANAQRQAAERYQQEQRARQEAIAAQERQRREEALINGNNQKHMTNLERSLVGRALDNKPVPVFSGKETEQQKALRGWVLTQAQARGRLDNEDQAEARTANINRLLAASPQEIANTARQWGAPDLRNTSSSYSNAANRLGALAAGKPLPATYDPISVPRDPKKPNGWLVTLRPGDKGYNEAAKARGMPVPPAARR